MKTVNDIIRKNITPLTREQSLTDAVEQILQSGMTGLPVVDEEKNCIGFLSEHDCIHHIISSSYYCDNRIQVKDLMHSEPLTVSPEHSLLEIAQLMSGQKPKVYPVIENNKLTGIINRQDVLKVLSAEMKHCVSFA